MLEALKGLCICVCIQAHAQVQPRVQAGKHGPGGGYFGKRHEHPEVAMKQVR